MDTLGIKDKVRSAGLSKNFKKPKDEWSPKELEIDNSMIVTFHPTTKSDPQHYSCAIPWKNQVPSLENNLKQVIARQYKTNYSGYLEKKGTSLDEINQKFEDQISKGYIEKVTDTSEINRKDCFYLNYFPVVDRVRDTTKLRIVFDAAAKDKFAKSLNSEIHKGPNRINDLFTILLKFRMFKYAVTADISEMFLRIRLNENDQRYHRFYWNGGIWQWTRTLFGNRASPDMSQKVLTTHAESHLAEFPLAAQVIMDDTYMDDTIKSLETESSCCKLVKELVPLISGLDMKIQKFYSNCTKALTNLPTECLSTKVHFEDKDTVLEANKVLGMTWDAQTDQFKYNCKFSSPEEFFNKLNFESNPQWTKRLILRLSATVYDPLGLISPFTVRARSILQNLWKEELTWDTPVPENYMKLWNDWLNELFELPHVINIPRYLKFKSNRTIELHVFADASTRVFATCVYARVLEKKSSSTRLLRSTPNTSRGEEYEVVDVSLVTSKARVTPSKTESVSRLELAACVIATRLGNAVAQSYNIDADAVQYWTDSKNCLFWLNSPSSILKTFVSNRVGEIQTNSVVQNWRHVPTDLNPADIPTRMPKVDELASNKLWWKGPEFLLGSESQWPSKFIPPADNEEAKDEFKKVFLNHFAVSDYKGQLDSQYYSVGSLWDGFEKLMKFTSNVFSSIFTNKSFIENQKLALEFQIRRAQSEDLELGELIEELRTTPKVKKLYLSITPFLDSKGVLRSKSRLAEISHLSYNTKFPVILSSKSNFTKLLVSSYHFKFEHTVSIDTVKAKLKDGYHILGLENLLKHIRSNCLVCKKQRAKALTQRIANIPEFRLEYPLSAFAKTGLDFAGPFEIKVGRARVRPKVYILLFTCLQTRAVHLEVTDAMDSNAVMNALSRFIDLRGMPTDIFSDNWKTFVSEDKELESWVRNLNDQFLITQTKANVKWTFTPPKGPHHGGIYEIMVKATKRCLKSLCHYPDLTMDEFRTFVSRVTCLLNGRPLTRVEVDNRTVILTPNHFLYGNLGGAISTERIDSPVKRWHTVHSLVNQFWSLFLKEYIPELRKARKWPSIVPNIEVGDVVLEIDQNIPRGMWKLAIVTEIHCSKDNLVRKCTIKTQNGSYTRPITNLCPLEIKTKVDKNL